MTQPIALVVNVLFLVLSVSTLMTSTTTAQRKQGARSVDFRNFLFHCPPKASSNLWGMKVEPKTIRLRRGKNVVKGEISAGLYGSTLDLVRYVDFDGDGKEEAFVVVVTTREAAGAYWEADYFVFKYRDGNAFPVFHEYRYKPSGVQVRGKSVVISAYLWRENDAHCCPSSVETSVYGWRGAGLVPVSRTLKPMP